MVSTEFVVFLGGLFVTACLVGGGVINLRRIDMQAMKSVDSMAALGVRAWSYLTPAQQDELKEIDSLLVQEEWLEEKLDASLLEGVSAERILIEFANRGFISLGQGVFRRHASPLDFIEPAAFIAETEETTKDVNFEEPVETEPVAEDEPKPKAEPLQEGALFDEVRKLHPSDALLKDIEAVEDSSTTSASSEEELVESVDIESSEEESDAVISSPEIEPEPTNTENPKDEEETSLQLILPEGDCQECEKVSSTLGKYSCSDEVVAEEEKEPKDTTE